MKKPFIILMVLIALSLISYVAGSMLMDVLCESGCITDPYVLNIVLGEHKGIDTDLFYASAIPFGMCYLFLQKISLLFGWTYQEASVYICIYAWQILLILTTIPILIKSIIKYTKYKKGCIAMILSICYTALYCYFTTIVFNHYPLSDIPNTFNQCVQDLKDIALYWNVTYETVNVCIYLIGFISISWINYLLYSIIDIKRSATQQFTAQMSK